MILDGIRKTAAMDRARAEEILERGPAVISEAEGDQILPGIARSVGGAVGGGLIGALLASKIAPKIPLARALHPSWRKMVGVGVGGFAGGTIAEIANPLIQASTERKYLKTEFPDLGGKEQELRHALSAPSDINKLVGTTGGFAGASAMHLAAKALAKKHGGLGNVAQRLAQKIKGGSELAGVARVATGFVAPFLPMIAGYIAGSKAAPKLVNNALGDRLHEDAIKRVAGEDASRLRKAEILGNFIGGAGGIAVPAASPFGYYSQLDAIKSIGKLPRFARAGGALARALANELADGIAVDQAIEKE